MEETLRKAHEESPANSHTSSFSSTASSSRDEIHRYSVSHEALLYSLPYLYLNELVAVRGVCKSLRQAVDEDDTIWQEVKIDGPLSWKLKDDLLLRITSKARGNLRSLVLIHCGGISDAGLGRVVGDNPNLTNLFVPGCSGLTAAGIVELVERLPKLEKIAVHGVLNMKDHLEILNALLHNHNPRPRVYYRGRRSHFPLGPGRDPVDIQICPRCREAGLVFDCTRKGCKEKMKKKRVACRGCYWCITRCEQCGGCLDFDDNSPELMACAHAMCSNCWHGVPECALCNRGSCCRGVRDDDPAGYFTCVDCFQYQDKWLKIGDEI